MTKALFLVNTIACLPPDWAESFESIAQFQQFLQDQEMDWRTFVPVEEKMQLVEMEPHHTTISFLGAKFNGPYYVLSEKLKPYLKQQSVTGEEITQVFYFSELSICDLSVARLFPNASFTFICIQNCKKDIEERWTYDDKKAYGVENWRFLDIKEWLDVVEVDLSKQKLEAHLPKAQDASLKPRL